ncbi:MAG: universal stress protein [Nitrospirae bacterium CG_4_9_14_3_um_filter_53_35]|nr:MAG: hypothetical protein AUK29_01115 [Nitrospirae bacterium CG2_30_53_67]PIS38142.1 MAG: universal stress protein [Nitrospirae bacterium CG08_land_8_20_14_0_20_52_24]PIV85086.1 MAG: universal stress protein [Nitrospirae bacterium CG17_big_fil_post_rev_8_21_14_2_50_50_9]PIW84678.1 MAG: universal stress protein [Nitrospirae bacterium CG_4_8_14_3_um_filter_50_41]PIX85358.1 MAG: universal stress protein [Nitrospirae bacterium CG_4_10_14_3_um_filter_53_41]PJA72947.1 MAG: universal stress protei
MIKTILIPTDGSAYSRYAVEYAVDLCAALKADLVLVSVVDVRFDMYDVYSEFHSPVRIEEVIREQMSKALDKQAAEIQGREIKVRKILKVGDVINEILTVVKEEGIDLIVIGTHGRKGVSRFLLGSTTEKLVRSAPCPVLTVRPPEEK